MRVHRPKGYATLAHKMSSPETLTTLASIRESAELLRGVAVRTPLVPCEPLSSGNDALWLKPESLQRGGAFKLRGAYTCLSRLTDEERKRGVVAPSSGNHAQAVALAASIYGVPCTVVMPTTVSRPKRAGAERLGARVELAGTTTDDRWNRAVEITEAEGSTLIPPYDHPDIIAGQGTVGLEIMEDLPGVRTVLVPVGGGGLSAGVATAVKEMDPTVRVVAVEPEGAPKLTRALEAGQPVNIRSVPGITDGLLAVRIGTVNFSLLQRHVDNVVTVTDDEVREAVRFLLDRSKLVVEPSGAVTVAAIMAGRAAVSGASVAVLSGGNIEWDGLEALLGAGSSG